MSATWRCGLGGDQWVRRANDALCNSNARSLWRASSASGTALRLGFSSDGAPQLPPPPYPPPWVEAGE